MAKIDVTTIEGFDSMSAEDKLKALMDFEYDDHLADVERYKNAVSKANSEVAEWKRKHKEQLSAEEKEKEEKAEQLQAMQEELAELKKEKTISEYVSKFVGLGYTTENANLVANALMEGNVDKVVELQKAFVSDRETKVKQDLIKSTPTPPNGDGGSTTTLEDLRKLSLQEQYAFAQTHPEEYKALYQDTSKGD